MQRTGIEYMTHTWNPFFMKCSKVSPGCDRCWHLGLTEQHAKNPILSHAVREAKSGGKPVLNTKEIEAPLRLRKPAVIGVQFMGDLFHKDVPDLWLAKVMNTIMLSKDHTYQILTKRPSRMLNHITDVVKAVGVDTFLEKWGHVLWGTTMEDQERANGRTYFLQEIKEISPKIVTWVSAEPLIGPIDFRRANTNGNWPFDWIAVGGESGKRPRPMDLDWCRGIRDFCRQTGTRFFMKQLGGHPDPRKYLYDFPMDLRIRQYKNGSN